MSKNPNKFKEGCQTFIQIKLSFDLLLIKMNTIEYFSELKLLK